MAEERLTGPVVVTGASGQVGTALRERLAELPNEVRPMGRGDDLAAAVRDADAVVHPSRPRALTVDEFVRHVNGPEVRIRHLRPGC